MSYVIQGTPRYIAKGQEEAAKQQAYMLRDLLDKHYGVKLTGANITNCFAALFHKMDWPTLTSNLRGESNVPYYALTSTDLSAPNLVSKELALLLSEHLPNQRYESITDGMSMATLLAGKVQSPIRAILDMPLACYKTPRTMAGALLTTLLAGRPSWQMEDYRAWANTKEQKENFSVFDGRTDRAVLPRYFNSDPLTNGERLEGMDAETGDTVIIPIEDVRYTRLNRPKGQPKTNYALAEHAPRSGVADAFYKQAVSYPMARHWFNAGNDLKVILFVGNAPQRENLSHWVAEGGKRDFDTAIQALCNYHSCYNVILIPIGLDEVRNPKERWEPVYKHTKALIHDLELADLKYNKTIDQISAGMSNDKACDLLAKATHQYNETLIKIVEAVWKDTREINNQETIYSVFGTSDMDKHLCFSGSPLKKVRQLVGLS